MVALMMRRPSPTRCVSRSARLLLVFGVGEVVVPLGVAFGDGDVGHEPIGPGAVPVLLAAGNADDVAGADNDDRATARLDSSFTLGDVEGLTHAVAVPGGVG